MQTTVIDSAWLSSHIELALLGALGFLLLLGVVVELLRSILSEDTGKKGSYRAWSRKNR